MDKKRKKEHRVNPATGLKEMRYEGDTFWQVVKEAA